MVKNVVFDIGGVLAEYRIMEFLSEKGFDAQQIRRILKSSVKSPFWGQFERDEITEEETIQGFASLDPEIADDFRKAFSNVEGMLVSHPASIPLIKALKQNGCRVWYLSNYSRKAYDECGESLAFMPYMDGGIVSFKVKKTKPDPAMFRLFLETFGLQAEDCIFVDDTAENVIAAESLGFHGIVFRGFEDLTEELRKYGFRVSYYRKDRYED